jgi:hypothetical protein
MGPGKNSPVRADMNGAYGGASAGGIKRVLKIAVVEARNLTMDDSVR